MENRENPNKERRVRTPRHHLEPIRDSGPLFKLRNFLNLVFMVLALAGIGFYLLSTWRTLAIVLMIVAVTFKFIEVLLRLFRK